MANEREEAQPESCFTVGVVGLVYSEIRLTQRNESEWLGLFIISTDSDSLVVGATEVSEWTSE